MNIIRLVFFAAFCFCAIAYFKNAFAQIPPHEAGTVCLTYQRFWCWANPPGPPGRQCACPSPYGMVPGQLI
jgi:hypothetical protein